MKKKEERKYFDREWKEMQASLKAWFKKEKQEDLHHFRVQVKKLRAFLILSESNEQHPKMTKNFKPVRRIFKQAGEIRNAHMNIELGKAQQVENDEFMNNQHLMQVKATRKFRSKKIRFLEKLKSAHQKLKQELKPINDVHISFFYENHLNQIAAMLAKLQFDDELHNCRKQVKILIYNHKLVRTALDTGFNGDYLEQVQTAIGDWHDHVLAINLFSSDEAKDKTVVSNLQKQDSELQKHITDLTKDFYNRATTVVELPVEQID
ncbi:MAG: hypothetical protein JWR67_3698 [Mucilaginibacter sp.]|nr:hypothetical protein [Mucilaginibacter sp.]